MSIKFEVPVVKPYTREIELVCRSTDPNLGSHSGATPADLIAALEQNDELRREVLAEFALTCEPDEQTLHESRYFRNVCDSLGCTDGNLLLSVCDLRIRAETAERELAESKAKVETVAPSKMDELDAKSYRHMLNRFNVPSGSLYHYISDLQDRLARARRAIG